MTINIFVVYHFVLALPLQELKMCKTVQKITLAFETMPLLKPFYFWGLSHGPLYVH
jgi:hypothetical protein